ncbi:MAG: sulfate reduction electron transfer complex DsrMKJOP subunit DsrJ [Desulfobacca sp.]|nr:sulfate reduction electron transfer complex DsrMKJOP subunit DsrJ [Desulfobacca sp.]
MKEPVKSEFGTVGEKPKVEKKFYNRNLILAGIIVFVALITYPIWNLQGKSVPPPDPKLDTPVIQKMAEQDRKCIEDKTYMRNYHMQMLDEWRDQVVRNGNREYTSLSGKKYTASLQNTCLECHSNKSQFCDQCHNYVGVAPYCWGCHLTREKKLAEAK